MDQNFNNGNGAPQNGGFEQGNYNAPQGNYGAPSSFDFKLLLKTEYLIGLLAVLSALTFFFTTLRIEANAAASGLLSLAGMSEYANIKISPLKMLTGIRVGSQSTGGEFGAIFLFLVPAAIAVCAFVKQIRQKMGDKGFTILVLCLAVFNLMEVFYYPTKGASVASASAYIKLVKTFGYWVSLFLPIIIACLAVFVLVGMLQYGSLKFEKAGTFNASANASGFANNAANANGFTPDAAPAQFCTNCGQKLENGSAFCTNCGQKVQ